MKAFFGTVLIILASIWGITRIVKDVIFGINCGGHMELAAKANSIELAKQEMRIVVKYLEDKHLTTGNTAVLWSKPQTDVGFFYKNMATSLQELQGVKEDATPLEKSNVLMKLRETLTATSSEGKEGIAVPGGLSIAPNNMTYAVWGWASLILALLGAFFLFAWFQEN